MGIFSSTGSIGNCAQCMNKAEVRVYPNDNPEPICENCYRENQKLEQKISDKTPQASQPEQWNPPASMGGTERDMYIDVISRMASDEWVKKFTKDIKRVLINDWKTLIRNERWFSLLELRRYALQVDTDMDKPKPKPVGFRIVEEVAPQPITRVRRKKQLKESIHA